MIDLMSSIFKNDLYMISCLIAAFLLYTTSLIAHRKSQQVIFYKFLFCYLVYEVGINQTNILNNAFGYYAYSLIQFACLYQFVIFARKNIKFNKVFPFCLAFSAIYNLMLGATYFNFEVNGHNSYYLHVELRKIYFDLLGFIMLLELLSMVKHNYFISGLINARNTTTHNRSTHRGSDWRLCERAL